MEVFRNFFAFVITMVIFSLWFLPAYMLYHTIGQSGWPMLYLPIVAITVMWGIVISKKYFDC